MFYPPFEQLLNQLMLQNGPFANIVRYSRYNYLTFVMGKTQKKLKKKKENMSQGFNASQISLFPTHPCQT